MQGQVKKAISAMIALASAAAITLSSAGTATAASSTTTTRPAAAKTTATVPSLRAFGISGDGKLMATFLTDDPGELNWVRRISGLVGDTAAIGIDFRVQDGKFYTVGNRGGIYTITLPTGSSDVIVTKVSQLSVGLRGTYFGVDFNPAADRLRVVSDTGQNLRHNLATNTTESDPALNTGPCAPAVTGITAAAYTNNDLSGATGTTLFDINTSTDEVVLQSPANLGLLATVGALGVAADANAGLDIYSDLSGGKTVSNAAFATLVVPNGDATLNSVDVLTGAATPIGDPFPIAITDIALALDTN
ncbi:DUF4394 domain-containing protein [Spongiactinospora sp. TRM90649]|uniref:DUF4394 domain-containing protein n=1 Tax=Spongiactinospora sp. TRM90649 TaxID=3031114 RepID=UPI0023F6BA2D|nr:DUF4394 domain-containing protein [Spongiactinospora sp. TRM90649]MDF5751137.1 DUF4394 domain-containing protein [Spongiactinospora sp. TRM90649]